MYFQWSLILLTVFLPPFSSTSSTTYYLLLLPLPLLPSPPLPLPSPPPPPFPSPPPPLLLVFLLLLLHLCHLLFSISISYFSSSISYFSSSTFSSFCLFQNLPVLVYWRCPCSHARGQWQLTSHRPQCTFLCCSIHFIGCQAYEILLK